MSFGINIKLFLFLSSRLSWVKESHSLFLAELDVVRKERTKYLIQDLLCTEWGASGDLLLRRQPSVSAACWGVSTWLHCLAPLEDWGESRLIRTLQKLRWSQCPASGGFGKEAVLGHSQETDVSVKVNIGVQVEAGRPRPKGAGAGRDLCCN